MNRIFKDKGLIALGLIAYAFVVMFLVSHHSQENSDKVRIGELKNDYLQDMEILKQEIHSMRSELHDLGLVLKSSQPTP